MKMQYHPDDATLLGFANATLERNFAVLVACHLRHCPRCRQRLRQAEQLGAELMQRLQPAEVSADCKQALFDRLDESTKLDPAERSATVTAQQHEPLIPALLQHWPEQDFDTVPWKRIAPGIQQHKIDLGSSNLSLLRIAPGTCMPSHGHEGSELTMILRGSYSDEIGRFQPGDVADLDDEIEHQPIADRDEPCICLVATDAPLRFNSWVPRLMQGLVFSFD
ncbi:transcriptional regulator [Motiliproteus coralliicola]|uniref:Transcriptional regulator n=1 Tax=Motiliproteus coralliicola TaxID=2283196 RepID=A0A369WUS1_9GAMM|nr:ChrR family anti-sigma-E factor [Motiliproteus coralliicola]RDE24873.1 transcriptional regulator [Motiliproteus coralliicola]